MLPARGAEGREAERLFPAPVGQCTFHDLFSQFHAFIRGQIHKAEHRRSMRIFFHIHSPHRD
jgi:hypothetical protein